MSLLINSTTLGNIIITLGSVFLLYYLIRKFAWDQITGIFVAREKKIATDIDSAENARQEAEILVQKRQEELAAARTEATQIIDEGILVANIAKAAARQPEMFSKLQTLMFTGVAFIEGTFFVLFALSYIV